MPKLPHYPPQTSHKNRTSPDICRAHPYPVCHMRGFAGALPPSPLRVLFRKKLPKTPKSSNRTGKTDGSKSKDMPKAHATALSPAGIARKTAASDSVKVNAAHTISICERRGSVEAETLAPLRLLFEKSTPRPQKTQIGQKKQTAQSPRMCQKRTPTPYPPQTFHEKSGSAIA